jgi:hypothetical protein
MYLHLVHIVAKLWVTFEVLLVICVLKDHSSTVDCALSPVRLANQIEVDPSCDWLENPHFINS